MIINKELLYVEPNQESSSYMNLTQYSLACMLEGNNDIINALQEQEVIAESSNNKAFSIEKIIEAIFKAFCNILKKIVGKFIQIIINLVSAGKSFELEVRAVGEKFKNIRGEWTMDDIWIFTNLEEGKYPDASEVKDNIIDTFEEYRDRFNNAMENSTNLTSAIQKLGMEDFNLQANIQKFRCLLLDTRDKNFDQPMSDEIFNKECYKLYRDGFDQPRTADLNGNGVYEKVYKPYLELGKLERKAKRESQALQDSCNKAKQKIENIKFSKGKFGDEAADVTVKFNEAQRNVCALFDAECRDIITMYTAKLNAYKEDKVQSMRILKNAMAKLAEQGITG